MRQWDVDLPTPPEATSADGDWKPTDYGFTLIRVPAGTFVRSNPFAQKKIEQTVTLTQEFWLSDREVSVDLFQEFIADEQYLAEKKPKGKWSGVADVQRSPTGQHPVQGVSWQDSVLFCNWLTAQEENLTPYYAVKELAKPTGQQTLEVEILSNGTGYRLPTEAEWEYACRAGSTTGFCFGNNVERLRDYAVYSATKTDVPGAKMCNRLGLFDMHGNVWEWCYDWYRPYDDQPATDPTGLPTGSSRVLRGGGWNDFAPFCQSGSRGWDYPASRSSLLGFRVALSPSGKSSK